VSGNLHSRVESFLFFSPVSQCLIACRCLAMAGARSPRHFFLRLRFWDFPMLIISFSCVFLSLLRCLPQAGGGLTSFSQRFSRFDLATSCKPQFFVPAQFSPIGFFFFANKDTTCGLFRRPTSRLFFSQTPPLVALRFILPHIDLVARWRLPFLKWPFYHPPLASRCAKFLEIRKILRCCNLFPARLSGHCFFLRPFLSRPPRPFGIFPVEVHRGFDLI